MHFYFRQTKFIAPYKLFSAIQMRVSGENLTFPFNQGVILVILLLKFRNFSTLELEISTQLVNNTFHSHQTKFIAPYKLFWAIDMRVSGENWTFRFNQGVILVILLLKFLSQKKP